MGLGNRTARSHATVAARKAAGSEAVFHDFQPGQKVMTTDGIAGVVASVDDGFAPGAETYHVVLENGMGGGEYRTSQLAALSTATGALASTEHLASEDYPELAEILHERPDIAVNQYLGSRKTADDGGDAGEPADAPANDATTPCDVCNGTGKEPGEPGPCPNCGGKGFFPFAQYHRHRKTRQSSWIRNEDHGWDEEGEEHTPPCRECGSTEHQEDDCDLVPQKRSASFDPYSMIAVASTDPEFRFHVTASWSDVREKAKRIRKEDRVRIVSAKDGSIAAEVKGDHHTYETQIVYVPGGHKSLATWHCGCKWAAYSWGRTGYWRKFEGRMCSHALALQYEAQSRGMFGREIKEDQGLYFQKAHQPIVVEYDKDKAKNRTRRTVPPGNMKTVFTSALEMDTLSPLSILVATAHLAGESHDEVQTMLRTASIQVEGFWPLLLRALPAIVEGAGAAAEGAGAAGMAGRALEVGKSVLPYVNFGGGGGGQKGGPTPPDAADTDPDGPQGPSTPSEHSEDALDFQDGRSLNFENDAEKTAAVNNPWGEPEPNQTTEPAASGATRPKDPMANPASTGFASAPDPSTWQQPMGLHYETQGMESYASFHGEAEDGDTDVCANCHGTIRRTTIDPGVPWIHHGSGNAKCDVSSPADAVMLQGVDSGFAEPTMHEPDHSLFEAALHESPEPALPTTDGEFDDPNDPLSGNANSNTIVCPSISNDSMSFSGPGIMSTGSVEDIVAQFQQKAAHLNPSGEGSADTNEIAQAAKAFLEKTAVRDFSPAERQALISEGKDVRAGNLDRLDIEGTHYAFMTDDDDTWMD